MAEDWLTVQDAAKFSGFHPESIRELVRDGKIKAQKFGIVWQVSRRSLENYVKAAEKSDDKRRGAKSRKRT